jgi:rSAM/selenodomain-associated transferase 2
MTPRSDTMTLAIVIPTLDEERTLERTLRSAASCLSAAAGDFLVVSDGGSGDRTIALARAAGARIAVGDVGRGPQLQRGAELAIAHGARALLFLHADTILPENAGAAVTSALERGAAGGGFLIAFDSPMRLLRLGERLVNLRTRRLRAPLGDQAQFTSAAAFERCGGFPPWPILEDVALLRRLRKIGRLTIIEARVRTDARRFEQRGVVRTVALNWLIWSLYGCGASPRALARFYRHVR